MLSSRPIVLLSLPSIALILGVVWFRRRNKNRITNGGDKADVDATRLKQIKEEPVQKHTANGINTKAAPSTVSKSMNINGSVNTEEENPATKLFGKSAPIKIVQNGRGTSPAKQQQQLIDSEVLKTKIQDAGDKALRSIDEAFENMSSPVDLPDSINKRIGFHTRNINHKKDEPVVIRATNTPKISPENSFLESKYTKECEQNNNIEPLKFDVKETKLSKELTSAQPTDKTNVDSNGTEKRNVDSASPSLSLCSVQSGDSGKGSSLPRSEATRGKITYEFLFPIGLLGHLYGRKRSFLGHIETTTSTRILLRKHSFSKKVRICIIEGTESQISAALAMIRNRLPAKRYPNFTMQRIHLALPQTVVPLSSESLLNLQLSLVEGINNDVLVSTVVSGGHIFVQQPLHPTHPSLAVLQKCLYDSYTSAEAPMLPGIEINAVCVMPVNGIWYRVQIVAPDAEDEQRCFVKFLDFGGYMNVHFNELRQIRSDFMGVPFQATECVLSNITPINGTEWSSDATDILCQLTKGVVLQAQICGYNSHNIPEIYLFVVCGPNNVVFINRELVARNLAQWVEISD